MAAPTVTARSGGEQSTDSTSHVITFPAFSNGQLLLVVFGIDQGASTTIASGSGWNLHGRILNNTCSLAVYWKIASGTGDNLTLTSDSSQQSIHNTYAITGGYYIDGSPSQRSDGIVNSLTAIDYDGDYLSIVGHIAPGSQTGLGAPSGYSNGQLRTPSGADGCTVFTAEKSFTDVQLAPSVTITGVTHGLNTPLFHLLIAEANPAVHGYPRVYSREVTDLSAATQTSHSIKMPPNIEVGDLLITFFACSGNTSIGRDTGISGNNWEEEDGDQNNVDVSSASYFKVAEGGDVLTLTTGTAQKSQAVTLLVKNFGSVQVKPVSYTKGSGTTIDEPLIYFAHRWRKMLYLNILATPGQTWYGTGVNAWTGFPLNSGGASVGIGEFAYGVSNEIDWGTITINSANWINWHYAIDGKYCNDIEFVGRRTLTFAGTSSGQNITTDTVLDASGANTVSVFPGDLLLLGYASGSAADRALNVTSTGWTRIDSKRYVNGSTYDVNMTMFYKVVGDTPDATTTISGTLNNADAGACHIFCFRGVDKTNPIDSVAWTSNTGTTTPTPASLNYVTPGSWPIQFTAVASATANGGFQPGLNWYWINLTSNDTNSITTTMNYARSVNIRTVPKAYVGGPVPAAGNSWGAYTIGLKPYYPPSSDTWTFETGTQNKIADSSSALSVITSSLGQKGSLCGQISPNSSSGFIFSRNLMSDKYFFQARMKIIVNQNPTSNTEIRLLHLQSLQNLENQFWVTSFRAQIATNGALTVNLYNEYDGGYLGSNVAINANTWYWVAFNYDNSNFNNQSQSWKLNNVTQNTSTKATGVYKVNRLVGRTSETVGSLNWNGSVFFDSVSYSYTDWPPYPTGRPKVYNGSTWVNKPLKRWTGSAWVEEPMYYWNGLNWEYVT